MFRFNEDEIRQFEAQYNWRALWADLSTEAINIHEPLYARMFLFYCGFINV